MCQSESSWCVRGRERRGMAVAEADDRDPAEQVEVALSVRVDEPGALAGDERDVVRARRSGSSAVEVDRRAHASTAVAPIVASTPSASGADRRAELRDDPAGELTGVEHPLGLDATDRRRDRAAEQEARDVGEEEDPLGAEPERERRGGLVGVDVQRACRQRRDDRDQPGGERVLDRRRAATGAARRRGRARAPASPRSPISSPKSGTASGPSAAQISALTAASECADDRERGGARHAPPADEGDVEPEPLHLGRDLRARAVDDADLVLARQAA